MINNLEKVPDYVLTGEVIHGKGLGKTMGMPTANIKPAEEIIPPAGVYIAMVSVDGREYAGITNIGTRPTVDSDETPTFETNIFDYEGDLYGKKLTLKLFKRLRPQMKFASKEELIAQIARDSARAREFFER